MGEVSLGRGAFDAYTAALPYKYNGLPWDLLRPQVQAAWAAAAQAAPELRPVERMALTTAKGIAQRGDLTGANTVLMLCLVIERLAGISDYLIEAEPGEAGR